MSVILPLTDDRGLGERSLASWVSQTLAGDRYEIIAVTSRSRSRLARRARSVLRPQDILRLAPNATEIELYQTGAEAAGGEILLFTEAHCLAEPSALSIVLKHFAGSPPGAVILGGDPFSKNELARFETELLEEGLLAYPADGWRRVTLRGFAISRAIWFEAGGFPTACGRFGEAALGMRLQRLGCRIDSCPEARVLHVNSRGPAELAAALLPSGRGQAVWRERCESGLEIDFLPRLPEWAERARWEPRLARHAARLLVRLLLGKRDRPEWQGSGALVARTLPAFVAAAFLGGVAPKALAAMRAGLALAGCRLGFGRERRFRAYRRFCSEMLRWGVLDHADGCQLPPAPAGDILRPSELPDGVFVGFYPAERWTAGDSRPTSRWTRPFALMRLGLPPADYRLTLDLRSPVPPDERFLRLFFNGQSLPAAPDGSFQLPRYAFRQPEQLLAITCKPFYPALAGLPDSRELGVAIFEMRFEKLG